MKKITILAPLMLLSLSVSSAELSSNYFEFTLGKKSEGNSSKDNAYNLKGLYSLTENAYFSAEYEKIDRDYRETTTYFIGAGYDYSIDTSSKLFLQLDFAYKDQVSEYDSTLSGYRFTSGYRNQLSEKIEGYAKVSYLSFESDGNADDTGSLSDSVFALGMKYSFTEKMNAVTELGDDSFKLGLRYEF